MAINLSNALSVFNSAGISINAEFLTLSSFDVHTILDCAKQDGYRKPKYSSKSTAHAYFCALQTKYNRSRKG